MSFISENLFKSYFYFSNKILRVYLLEQLTRSIRSFLFILSSTLKVSLMSHSKNQVLSVTFHGQKLRRVPTKCAVCSAAAIYAYCGVVVCPCCKIFFKRNSQKETVSLLTISIYIIVPVHLFEYSSWNVCITANVQSL